LGLGVLQQRIAEVPKGEVRFALATVFSDILRYQNMLCRYDTSALKCQDIFSVHGFPVGLVQCENNLTGIPKVGSGGFRHFVEKYMRAKQYCVQPFETMAIGRTKRTIPIRGESISADLTCELPRGDRRLAFLKCAPAATMPLDAESLDGVFTDPPYFANVQYAELMDFCYAWLKRLIGAEIPEFNAATTRSPLELTGNITRGRDIEHFAAGLSEIFCHYADALRIGAPFVFTYHHNDPAAYAPLVLALLDAGLYCTEVIPAPAEMAASIHINGTGSSTLDSVFVSRRQTPLPCNLPSLTELAERLARDCAQIAAGGVSVTLGDAKCLASGHIARWAIHALYTRWPDYSGSSVASRLDVAGLTIKELAMLYSVEEMAIRAIRAPIRDESELILI